MKKFFILVISASVLLTGCVLPSFSKHRPRHSSESAASSRRTKSSSNYSSSSSKSSSSSSESTEIVSKTLVGDIEEIHTRWYYNNKESHISELLLSIFKYQNANMQLKLLRWLTLKSLIMHGCMWD